MLPIQKLKLLTAELDRLDFTRVKSYYTDATTYEGSPYRECYVDESDEQRELVKENTELIECIESLIAEGRFEEAEELENIDAANQISKTIDKIESI